MSREVGTNYLRISDGVSCTVSCSEQSSFLFTQKLQLGEGVLKGERGLREGGERASDKIAFFTLSGS